MRTRNSWFKKTFLCYLRSLLFKRFKTKIVRSPKNKQSLACLPNLRAPLCPLCSFPLLYPKDLNREWTRMNTNKTIFSEKNCVYWRPFVVKEENTIPCLKPTSHSPRRHGEHGVRIRCFFHFNRRKRRKQRGVKNFSEEISHEATKSRRRTQRGVALINERIATNYTNLHELKQSARNGFFSFVRIRVIRGKNLNFFQCSLFCLFAWGVIFFSGKSTQPFRFRLKMPARKSTPAGASAAVSSCKLAIKAIPNAPRSALAGWLGDTL